MRRAVQVGAFSGPNEPRGVVRPRRGSNPARIRVIGMVHHGRAEIFALPYAHTPTRLPGSSPATPELLELLNSFSQLTSKKRNARLANSQLLLHYTGSEVRC